VSGQATRGTTGVKRDRIDGRVRCTSLYPTFGDFVNLMPFSSGRAFTLATLLVLFSLSSFAPARAGTALGASADSARRASWTLANGMHAVVQHVPECRGVAISVGYAGGYDQDPIGREGLALMLAELQFTSAAGTMPERTRREVASQRPQGFDVHVGRNFTVFTEVASSSQLAGTLLQIAARLKGVQPDAAILTAARETVREKLKSQFLDDPSVSLYNEVERRAGGADNVAMGRLASLSGIDKLAPKDFEPLLRKSFPSKGAVISLVGNFEGVNVRALLDQALAGVAGGPPTPLPPMRTAHAANVVAHRAGLTTPVGVLGICAPALTDSTYPAFYVATLVLGAEAISTWGEPVPPLRSRFQYSVLEDPALVRFYPQLMKSDQRAQAIGETFNRTLGSMDNLIVSDDLLETLRAGVAWLLGGPIHDEALDRIRTNSSALILCSTNMAERELRGGEKFWSHFRREVERANMPDLVYWLGYMRDPKLQVGLLYLPN
jgi:predicted Zn-dependent peptidase